MSPRRSHVSETEVLDVLQRLVAIPFVNPILCPHDGDGETAIAAWADRWLACADR